LLSDNNTTDSFGTRSNSGIFFAFTYCLHRPYYGILFARSKQILAKSAAATAIDPVSNDGAFVVNFSEPYVALVSVLGTAPILYHRWSVDGVEAKAKAAKGSKAKKEDDLESYVYRDSKGYLSIPGEYFRMSLINAAKFKQDPRSPRKSAMDLFKAAVVVLEEHCSLGVKEWTYVDKRRVQIQRNAITRARPAVEAGWKCDVLLQVLLPEYVGPDLLNEVIQSAGRLVGVGDFRPTFGRFQVTQFKLC
jgi:hypothetical protein